MPEWKIHDLQAEKMGINPNVSRKVNEIIDFGFRGHDDRSYTQREFFFLKASEAYEIGGWDGVKAFFLHHVMDYMDTFLREYARMRDWDWNSSMINHLTRYYKNQIVMHVKYNKLYEWRDYTIRDKKNSKLMEKLLGTLNRDLFEFEEKGDEVIIKFSDAVSQAVESVSVYIQFNFWEIAEDILESSPEK